MNSAFDSLMASLPNASTKARGDAFELIVRWYLQNDPLYKPFIEQVWLWDEWEGRWASDEGIDLVARDRDGAYWAIQAKAYSQEARLTYRDLATFFSATQNTFTIGKTQHRFATSLLVASTDELASRADAYIRRNNISLVLRDDLRRSALEWPAKYNQNSFLKPAKPQPRRRPRPHQKKAVQALSQALADGGRAQAVMACGTGKTLVGLWTDEALKSDRTLVLLPSLALVRQTLKEWTSNRTRDFQAMTVCSDESVADDSDALELGRAELGIPTTTDPKRIASFLRKSGRLVVFSTYQSASAISTAQKSHRAPAFDLVVGDEAHRMTGPADSTFARCLDGKFLRAQRRLHMTATPRVFTPRLKKRLQDADLDVASMDDETRFGRVAFRMTFGEAIAHDPPLLSDYQVVIVGVTDAECRDMIEHGALIDHPARDARSLAAQVALLRTMRNQNLRRVVSFHGRVNKAQRFSSQLPETAEWMRNRAPKGSVHAEAVSGRMTTGARERVLDRLREPSDNECVVVSNARCLAEGVDVPALDGVAFIDPRGSEIDIIQAVGRAIRLSPDKKIGTIVLPVVIDEDADPDEVLSNSSFRAVWNVLRALRSHDEALGEELDELRRETGRTGNPTTRVPRPIVIDLPRSIPAGFMDALTTRIIDSTTLAWDEAFGLLERYVAENGDAFVYQGCRIDGFNLGTWVNGQRTNYKRGTLSPERIARLESIPEWVWDARDGLWKQNYDLLAEYGRQSGDTTLPTTVVYQGRDLGSWARTQRIFRDKGTLSAERIELLEALPNWSWNPEADKWNEYCAALERHVARFGTADVKANLQIDGRAVGQWASRQRQAHKASKLEDWKTQRLERLPGWRWEAVDSRWDAMFAQLAGQLADDAIRCERDTRRPESVRIWIAKQRASYRSGRLRSDRKARLDALPGWTWEPYDSAWQDAYEKLRRLAAKTGTSRIAVDVTSEDFAVGTWVNQQRISYRSNKLDPDKRQQLEALPGWVWNPKAHDWEFGFQELLSFVEEHGTSRVPSNATVAGFKLGGWVNQQRSAYREGKLDPEKAIRLEALPGWAWNPHDEQWEASFKLVTQYQREYGNLQVPKDLIVDGVRLSTWIAVQRESYRKAKLRRDRAAKLETLPGWRWSGRFA
jgi:superfamily II DNA or RNA helicase